MEKLRPCPFCGGVGYLDFSPDSNKFYWGEDGFEKNTPMLYRVFCGACKCQTERAQTPKTAIMIWNRRADDVLSKQMEDDLK